MEFEYETLPSELRDKIALESNYKDLLNLCKTSREAFGEICGSNGFWKQKTYYDFRDLYDIEKFGRNWWDTYQYYRSVFTLDFIEAIKIENQEPLLLEGLLRRGFLIVNFQNEDEETALMWASYRGYMDIVRMLLNAGVDPDLANKYGETAIMYASMEGQPDIVEILESVKTPVPSGGFFGRLRSGADRTLKYIFDVDTEEDVVGGAGFEPL